MDFHPEIPSYQIVIEYRQEAERPVQCGADLLAMPAAQAQAMGEALSVFLADPANTVPAGPELQAFLRPPPGRVHYSETRQTYQHGIWALTCDRGGALVWHQRPAKMLILRAAIDRQGADGDWFIRDLQTVLIHPRPDIP